MGLRIVTGEDMDSLLKKLEEYHKKALLGGGPEKIKAQKSKGKLTARERIELLFDKDSFEEIGWMVTHRSREFGLDKIKFFGDGVVTGYGKIDGRPVYVFAEDFTVMGGSIGEMHAKKIVNIYKLALKTGAPVVGIYDSGGARIQEGVASLDGVGRIFYSIVRASGIIPQIALIMGPCAGGAAYAPALMDFVIMRRGPSYLFVTGPEVVKAATGEEVTFEELGGADIHGAVSGVAHFVTDTEEEALELTRVLLGFLPSNYLEEPPVTPCEDPVDRVDDELRGIVPTDPHQSYDVRDIITRVVDEGFFLEVHADYATNAVVGFARLAGRPVCMVANQPSQLAGVIDINASDKIARFVRICDAFNLPIITFVDVPGFMPGTDQEHGGIIRHGAKILYAYSEATVPKITVILRKAYGGAYIAMGSRSLGADIVYAWPTAEIAVMGAEGAVNVLYRKQLSALPEEEREKQRKKFIEEYKREFLNPYKAAELGLVDDVIDPAYTRQKLVKALEILESKKEIQPPRKHGIPPF